MAKWKKASHVVYQCSYHLVWTPKYRYKILQGEIKDFVERKIRAVCEWKRVEILEMTIMPDHIHMVAIIPPKLAISELMGINRVGGRPLAERPSSHTTAHTVRYAAVQQVPRNISNRFARSRSSSYRFNKFGNPSVSK